MARRKRKLQEATAQDYPTSYWKAAISEANMSALLLDMELSISNAKRLGLQLVRFNRMRHEHADLLVRLVREEISKWKLMD